MMDAELPAGAKYATIPGEYYPNRKGIDFYHHFKEDIGLFGEMGFKALNLSISWARIFPKGVKAGVNPKGVEYYRAVLEECRKYGIEPIVTLYKYDLPVFYIEEMGGWKNRFLIDEFVAFARICFTEYRDLVKYWVTFNEINFLLLFAKGKPMEQKAGFYQQLHNQLVASARAVALAHEINPLNRVGSMNVGMFSYPLTCDPEDILLNQRCMQETLYYASDVQVRGSYPSFAENIWKENGISLEMGEDDERVLRAGTVDFYAFS